MEKSIDIFIYLNNNSYKDKEFLIKNIILILKCTRKKAVELYYCWKARFMKSMKCIPNNFKIPIKEKFKVSGNVVIGKYGEYKILEGCIVVGYHFFNTIDEIERYRYFRRRNNLKEMDNILDEAIEIFRLRKLLVSKIQ